MIETIDDIGSRAIRGWKLCEQDMFSTHIDAMSDHALVLINESTH